ncbi:hypothetical protein UCDDA912_g00366 [Diaporthe ampelina]|uniref:Uncharacterized protein n=1 Tax=Diaporthe ampelina TaxID=1214573 RepID=A0A0G2FZV4_9PEZI|nr:hypothetical protein UCDDA912_g00366 [Diaporthe ampelina]
MSLITLALFLITWLIQAAQTFKTIPDLKALGYDVYGSNPASGDWVHYEVSHGATFLADLAIYKNNEKPDVLAVFNAQTADDDRPGRLPLRDILLGVWVHSVGRDPADLLAIQYRDVYEDDLVVATHRVYGLMGESESQDLMQVIPTCIYIPEYKVLRDHHSDEEEEAYDLLHDGTAFGAGAQKMIDEFEEMHGKNVEAFGYNAQAPSVFHFAVYFWI